LDKKISKLNIDNKSKPVENPLFNCSSIEIDEKIFHDIPYYHGVRGSHAQNTMQQFTQHGFSQFGPNHACGPNVLFATGTEEYAKDYGGLNVLKLRLRKEFPILNHYNIKISSGGDREKEKLIYDLLYEKGIKFLKNDRETIILDPKAVTIINDYKVTSL